MKHNKTTNNIVETPRRSPMGRANSERAPQEEEKEREKRDDRRRRPTTTDRLLVGRCPPSFRAASAARPVGVVAAPSPHY